MPKEYRCHYQIVDVSSFLYTDKSFREIFLWSKDE